MPAPETLIALETTTASTMSRAWSKIAHPMMGDIEMLLSAGRYDDAHDIAAKMTMKGIVDEHRKRLEELGVSALLFGASNVVGKVTRTSLYKDKQKLPEELQSGINQLTIMVEAQGADIVRAQMHDVIETEAVKSKDRFYKAELTLAQRLNDAVIGSGKAVIDTGANLTTSRLVSLGFLAEAINQQIDTFQVNEVLDSRTCKVCRYMHGKTFQVQHEYTRNVSALSTFDPKELRGLAPWPSNTKAGIAALYKMSAPEMQSAGYGSPPYHPGCRGLLALTGTVTEEIEFNPKQLAILNALFDGTKGPAQVEAPEAPSSIVVMLTAEQKLLERISAITDQETKDKASALYNKKSWTKLKSLLDDAGV